MRIEILVCYILKREQLNKPIETYERQRAMTIYQRDCVLRVGMCKNDVEYNFVP